MKQNFARTNFSICIEKSTNLFANYKCATKLSVIQTADMEEMFSANKCSNALKQDIKVQCTKFRLFKPFFRIFFFYETTESHKYLKS